MLLYVCTRKTVTLDVDVEEIQTFPVDFRALSNLNSY
jgi:hypothetical protein